MLVIHHLQTPNIPSAYPGEWEMYIKKSYLLGTRTADVRAKHDFVGTLAVHVLLFQLAVEDFEVATSTVDVLFMFHGELYHQGLALVAERLELARESVEPRVLRGLQTCEVPG